MKKLILFGLFVLPAAVRAQSQPANPAFTSAGGFIALSVPDLEASSRWYQEKLGLRVVQQPPPYQGVSVRVLEGGGLIVELIHNPKAVPLRRAAPAITETMLVHGIVKAGIVVSEYDRTLATLRERGVPIELGPFPARDGQRANFIIRDASGNLLQFFGR